MKIKMKLKKWLVKHPCFYNVMWVMISYITNYKGREHKCKFGKDNADKIFYLIRPRTNGIEGLMSLFVYSIQRVEYAKRKGYIPVIDWLNYKTQYYDGKNNVWEWFFSQPSEYTLEDVYSSKNVILSGYRMFEKINKRVGSKDIFFDDELRKTCAQLVCNNIRINSNVLNIVESEKINIPINECIGVYLRGTDYVKLKPAGEHIQPSVEDMIHKIQEFKDKYNNPPVFLVTEDYDIYIEIKKQLVDNLHIVSFDSFIKNYDGKDFLSRSNVLEKDKLKLGKEYLAKILLLSQCKYLVTSITCGSIATCMFDVSEYEDLFAFELGLYE